MKQRILCPVVLTLMLILLAMGASSSLAQGPCPDCGQGEPSPPGPPPVGGGATYITAEDNEDNARSGHPDYDMYPQASCIFEDNPKAPIEFNIDLSGALPTSEATLTLHVWDVDEEGSPPERDEVYFNSTKVGNLTGADSTWSTSVFPLDIGLVKPGHNLVEIQIDTYPGSKSSWCVGVQWGQLLVDGGSAVKASMARMDTEDCYEIDGIVDVDVAFAIDVTAKGHFRLETNLVDPKGITLDADVHEFSSGVGRVNYTASLALDSSSATLGTYTVNASLFDADTRIQQSVEIITFELAAECPAAPTPTPIPPPGQPIPEASSILLLGSGLAALAGYAGLRLRARRGK